MMYKVTFVNTQTHVTLVQYGFSKYTMEKIYHFLNEVDTNFYPIWEIQYVTKIVFNFNTFMKCLTHYEEIK